MKMKKCRYCHTVNHGKAKFCYVCGKKIKNNVVPVLSVVIAGIVLVSAGSLAVYHICTGNLLSKLTDHLVADEKVQEGEYYALDLSESDITDLDTSIAEHLEEWKDSPILEFDEEEFTAYVYDDDNNLNEEYLGNYEIKDGEILFTYEKFKDIENNEVNDAVSVRDSEEEFSSRLLKARYEEMKEYNKTGVYCKKLYLVNDKLFSAGLPFFDQMMSTQANRTIESNGSFLCVSTYGTQLEGKYKTGKSFTINYDIENSAKDNPNSKYYERKAKSGESSADEWLDDYCSWYGRNIKFEFSDGTWTSYSEDDEVLFSGKYYESDEYEGLIIISYSSYLSKIYISQDGEVLIPFAIAEDAMTEASENGKEEKESDEKNADTENDEEEGNEESDINSDMDSHEDGITAYIVDEADDSGVDNVEILVTDEDGETVTDEKGNAITATTDSKGRFELVLPDGNYHLIVEKDGYMDNTMEITVKDQQIENLQDSDGKIELQKAKNADEIFSTSNYVIKDSIKQVAGSIALSEEGAVYDWGANKLTPEKLNLSEITDKIVAIEEAKYDGSVFLLTKNGDAYYLPQNEERTAYGTPQLLLSDVKKICSGALITNHGDLYVQEGEYDGNGTNSYTESVNFVKVNSLSNVIFACCNQSMNAVVMEDGKLYTWGDNSMGAQCYSDGHLGYSAEEKVKTPREATVVNSLDSKIIEAWCDSFTGDLYYLTEDGKVYICDYMSGSCSNKLVSDCDEKIVHFSYGVAGEQGSQIFMISENGNLYGYGYNCYGYGDGDTSEQNQSFHSMDYFGTVKDAYTAGDNFYVVTYDGSLYAWGDNASGEVGNGECCEYDSMGLGDINSGDITTAVKIFEGVE